MIAVIDQVARRAIPFRARQTAGDPIGENGKTRRLAKADLESVAVRRTRVRYWVAIGYVRLLVAHELYPDRFVHVGPVATPACLARLGQIYAERYGKPQHGFAARPAGF